jgi:hypothetical protein
VAAAARAALGDGEFGGRWEIGRLLSSEEVVAFA